MNPDAASTLDSDAAKKPRHRAIRDALRADIESGAFHPGDRLPSDADLAARFDTSRLTVIRALRDLETEGVVRRKAGSGTFVGQRSTRETLLFGLLMPDLGDGEVFEPIARGIARSAETLHHTLLWGGLSATGPDKEKQAEDLCQYFISRKVAGVFFSPVELTPNQDAVNERIAAALNAASIPVVLVDRCYRRFPERSHYDLVGIDNRRAGCRMARHLLDAGATRVGFVYRRGSAQTVNARLAGYREALSQLGLSVDPVLEFDSDPSDLDALSRYLSTAKPNGLLCANDLTAARLMPNLLRLGVKIPSDIRMVGINDVKYASFLPVPLTTLHQPCEDLGAAALQAMLERLKKPAMPARDISLDCRLIVRQSCGANPVND